MKLLINKILIWARLRKAPVDDALIFKAGTTFVRFGDGFGFVINKHYSKLSRKLCLTAFQLYDYETNKWVKNRWGEHLARPDVKQYPLLGYDELVTLGYMQIKSLDGPHGNTAIYTTDDYSILAKVRAYNKSKDVP